MTDHLNIRATPSKKGAIIGKIGGGHHVNVAEIKDGWAKIVYDGREAGYVASQYIVLVQHYDDSKTSYPNAERDEDVKDSPDSAQDATNNQAASLASETTEPKNNVFFIGDSTILTPYEKEQIENQLQTASDYIFVVNTVGNVPTGELFDYAPDLLDNYSKELDSSMNWWQTFKSWFGGDSPSSNIILLSYIKDCNLLQAECNGNSLKYLKMSMPEKYFSLQYDTYKGAADAIIGMGLAIDEAGKEYSQRNFFIRGQINTGNIFEYVCDDFIVENILPRDSFWHKWVFRWLFAWPLKTANWIFVLTGSYLVTLIILMSLVLGFYFFKTHLEFLISRKYTLEQINSGKAGCLTPLISGVSKLCSIYLWLAMISLVVYMMPDMCNIVVMSKSGYSEAVISTATQTFLTTSTSKNWLLVTMFFIGIIISSGVNKDYTLLSTLPSYIQKMSFEENKEKIKNSFIISGQDFDEKKLEKSNYPYRDINFKSEELGKILGPAIPLSFVFSGTLLLYATIFLWTKSLKILIHIITGVISFAKRGLYK